MRLTLTNDEADIIIGIGLAGGQANTGGRTGAYELQPGEAVPVEIDTSTTITFTSRRVDKPTAPA